MADVTSALLVASAITGESEKGLKYFSPSGLAPSELRSVESKLSSWVDVTVSGGVGTDVEIEGF